MALNHKGKWFAVGPHFSQVLYLWILLAQVYL